VRLYSQNEFVGRRPAQHIFADGGAGQVVGLQELRDEARQRGTAELDFQDHLAVEQEVRVGRVGGRRSAAEEVRVGFGAADIRVKSDPHIGVGVDVSHPAVLDHGRGAVALQHHGGVEADRFAVGAAGFFFPGIRLMGHVARQDAVVAVQETGRCLLGDREGELALGVAALLLHLQAAETVARIVGAQADLAPRRGAVHLGHVVRAVRRVVVETAHRVRALRAEGIPLQRQLEPPLQGAGLLHGEQIFVFCPDGVDRCHLLPKFLEIFVDAVGHAGDHLGLVGGGGHELVLGGVGHVAELDHGGRHLGPVVAGHGVGLPDIFPAAAGRLHIAVQDAVGEELRLLVHALDVGIVLRDADGHGAGHAPVGGPVGVHTDENIRLLAVRHLRALDAAVGALGVVAGHIDFVAALLKLCFQLLRDGQDQFIFHDAGCDAARADRVGRFLRRGAGTQRHGSGRDLRGVAGVDDDDFLLLGGLLRGGRGGFVRCTGSSVARCAVCIGRTRTSCCSRSRTGCCCRGRRRLRDSRGGRGSCVLLQRAAAAEVVSLAVDRLPAGHHRAALLQIVLAAIHGDPAGLHVAVRGIQVVPLPAVLDPAGLHSAGLLVHVVPFAGFLLPAGQRVPFAVKEIPLAGDLEPSVLHGLAALVVEPVAAAVLLPAGLHSGRFRGDRGHLPEHPGQTCRPAHPVRRNQQTAEQHSQCVLHQTFHLHFLPFVTPAAMPERESRSPP